MKANTNLKFSLSACVVLCSVSLVADTWKVTSPGEMIHNGKTITLKDANYGPTMGLRKSSYSEGSIGFFRDMGADTAVSILEGTHDKIPDWYDEANVAKTNPSIYDTTNLDNMQKSFVVLEKANEFRQEEGEEALTVSHNAMAISQLRTQWSRYNVEHAESNYYLDQNGQNLRPYEEWWITNEGENLGWSYTSDDISGLDPTSSVQGWYDEKACHTDPNGAKCREISKINISQNKTGHYDNLVDSDKKITGAAIGGMQNVNLNGRNYNGITVGQVYAWDLIDGETKSYSVAEYKKLFEDWRNDKILSNGQTIEADGITFNTQTNKATFTGGIGGDGDAYGSTTANDNKVVLKNIKNQGDYILNIDAKGGVSQTKPVGDKEVTANNNMVEKTNFIH